eukprot:4610534-Prymnesium_polylepis.1
MLRWKSPPHERFARIGLGNDRPNACRETASAPPHLQLFVRNAGSAFGHRESVCGMAAWYDDPCFDDESDMAGVYEFRGDSWRRLQSLKERGVPCGRVVEVAGVTFRKAAIDGVLREG